MSRGSLKAWAGRSTHSSRPLLSVSSLLDPPPPPPPPPPRPRPLLVPLSSRSFYFHLRIPSLFFHFRFSLSTELGSATTLMHLERTPPRAEEGRSVRASYTCERMLRNEITARALFSGVVSNRGTRISRVHSMLRMREEGEASFPFREKLKFSLNCRWNYERVGKLLYSSLNEDVDKFRQDKKKCFFEVGSLL